MGHTTPLSTVDKLKRKPGALTSPGQVLRSYWLFAWNVPEWTNFYTKSWLRLGCYLGDKAEAVEYGRCNWRHWLRCGVFNFNHQLFAPVRR